jgi:hypothetical protein
MVVRDEGFVDSNLVIHDSTEVRRDPRFQPAGGYGGECLRAYYPRLLGDGRVVKDMGVS